MSNEIQDQMRAKVEMNQAQRDAMKKGYDPIQAYDFMLAAMEAKLAEAYADVRKAESQTVELKKRLETAREAAQMLCQQAPGQQLIVHPDELARQQQLEEERAWWDDENKRWDDDEPGSVDRWHRPAGGK